MLSKIIRIAASCSFFLAAAGTAHAQTAVATQIEFGPYINCFVQNNINRPVMIRSIKYDVVGINGPASQIIPCVNSCGLNPGNFNKFSGPPNNTNITAGACYVTYDIL